MAVVLFLLISTANAGCIGNLLERWGLIADDPYDYETASEAWIKREIVRLEIRERFEKATKSDLSLLKILRNELRRRGSERDAAE